MIVQIFKRVSSLDFSDDVPEWALAVFSAINFPLEQLNNALQKRLTVTDNFDGEVQIVNITHNVPTMIYVQKRFSRPRFVIAGFANGEVVAGCGIKSYVSDKQFQLVVTFQSANPNPVAVNLMLLGS
jgi:hypothetical protein